MSVFYRLLAVSSFIFCFHIYVICFVFKIIFYLFPALKRLSFLFLIILFSVIVISFISSELAFQALQLLRVYRIIFVRSVLLFLEDFFFGVQDGAPTNWATWPGWAFLFLCRFFICFLLGIFAFLICEDYTEVPFFCPLYLILLFAKDWVWGWKRHSVSGSSRPGMCFRTPPCSDSSPVGSVSVLGEDSHLQDGQVSQAGTEEAGSKMWSFSEITSLFNWLRSAAVIN